MFLNGNIFTTVTLSKTLNQIFTCDLGAWSINLQQCPGSPKSNSISRSQIPLKIWVLHVLIFQGFDPPARPCTLSALPGCFYSWAQHWGVKKAVYPSGKEKSKPAPIDSHCLLEAQTSSQTGVQQVMTECICTGASRLPSDSVII